MQRTHRYLLIGLALCWIGHPAWSAAQADDSEKIRMGGSYSYLRFPTNGGQASLASIDVMYMFNPQWSLSGGLGVARGNLNLNNTTVVFPGNTDNATLIPLRLGLTRSLRLPEGILPGGSAVNYRAYATAGVSLVPAITQDTPANANAQASNRFGLLTGPYSAFGFAIFSRNPVPISVDISVLEMYYYRTFPSRFRAIEGMTYGSSIMVSVSFVRRGR